ncbi:MAG: primosomal protein N' [Candidatus Aminicenantia bacterium]
MNWYAEVALPLPFSQTFYYLIPDKYKDKVFEGARILVSVRKKKLTGFIISLEKDIHLEKDIQLKEIEEVLDKEPILPQSVFQLTKRLSDYYLTSWGELLYASLPPSLVLKSTTKISLTEQGRNSRMTQALSKKEREILDFIGEKSFTFTFLRRKFKNISPLLTKLEKKGLIKRQEEVKKIKRRGTGFSYPDSIQLEFGTILDKEETEIIKRIQKEIEKAKFSPFLFMADQEQRNNIYLELIKEVLNKGKKVIYLVPEIILAEPIVCKLKTNIGERIALLHSKLTEKQREAEWLKIKENKIDLVIGPRSAIFSPLSDLGLIIVDKEEDESYIQQENPKYDARQAALMRGELEKAIVIFGSNTPSVENYYYAQKNNCLLYLNQKGLEFYPSITIVDTRKEKGLISRFLRNEIEKKIEVKEKVLIFTNRRGYAKFLICFQCGYLIKCKDCDIPLTYHKKNKRMICSYCYYSQKKPEKCPNCKMKIMKMEGPGTELIGEKLKSQFERARIKRFDLDTARDRKSQEKIINDFNRGIIDILVGTQLLTYQSDFTSVSLIGILFPENMLAFPDYKAGERAFHLISRVISLLDKKGKVIIQTALPSHYVLRAITNHNYLDFYNQEIKFRQLFNYPPFSHLIEIIFSGKNLRSLAQKVRAFTQLIRNFSQDIQVLGPNFAPLSKIKGKFRIQLIIKGKDRVAINEAINHSLRETGLRNLSIYF